jgi:hypothetical protein
MGAGASERGSPAPKLTPVPWLCLYAIDRIVVPRRGRSRSLRTGGSGTQPGPCLSVKKGRIFLRWVGRRYQGLASHARQQPSLRAGISELRLVVIGGTI